MGFHLLTVSYSSQNSCKNAKSHFLLPWTGRDFGFFTLNVSISWKPSAGFKHLSFSERNFERDFFWNQSQLEALMSFWATGRFAQNSGVYFTPIKNENPLGLWEYHRHELVGANIDSRIDSGKHFRLEIALRVLITFAEWIASAHGCLVKKMFWN